MTFLVSNTKWLKGRDCLLIFTLLFFYLGEILTNLSVILFDQQIRFTGISKIIMSFVFSLYIIIFRLEYVLKNKKILLAFLILCLSYLIGSCVLKSNVELITRIKYNSVYFFRYSYIFFLVIIFKDLSASAFYKVFKVVEIIFWANCFFILIGFVFEIPLFKGYGVNRFGYTGLFARTSQATYIFILMVSFYYFKWIYCCKKIYFFLVALIISLLVGTKAIYFAMFNLLIYHLIFHWKTLKKVHFFVVVVSLIGFIIILSQTFLKDTIYLFYEIYKKEGILTSVFSYRNLELLDYFRLEVLKSWTWLNYIFGSGNFLTTVRTELELFDLFFFFGIVGLVIFAFIYCKLFSFVVFDKFLLFLSFNIGFVSMLSGNLIHSPELPIYLYIILINMAFIKEKINEKTLI